MNLTEPCIEWPGKLTPEGYGRTSVKGKRTFVHRREWMRKRGPIPDGMFVCHHCDNRACFNVNHLFLGTAKDNNMDCARKGRKRRLIGEMNPTAKLSLKQVEEIRAIGASEKQRDVAKRYGVSQKVIWNVLRNRSWTGVPCGDWRRVKKGEEGAIIEIQKL